MIVNRYKGKKQLKKDQNDNYEQLIKDYPSYFIKKTQEPENKQGEKNEIDPNDAIYKVNQNST